MVRKYIRTYEILFFEVLFLSILLVITIIILLKLGNLDIGAYFEILDLKEIIILIILTLINFIYNFIQLIIIDIFSSFHILLTNLIPQNLVFLFLYNSKNSSISTIFTIVLILIDIFMIHIFVEFI